MVETAQPKYAPPPGPPPPSVYAPPPGPPPSVQPVPLPRPAPPAFGLVPVPEAPFDMNELALQGWVSLPLDSVYPKLYEAFEELFTRSREFFASPDSDRLAYYIPAAMQTSEEGYSVVEGEKLLITLRRSGHCPPGLLPAAETAWNLTGAWLSDMLRIVAKALALPENAFEPLGRPCATLPTDSKVATLLRLFRYDRPLPSEPARVVSEAHRDLGLLTLVVGHTPGLDAWDVLANRWRSVEDSKAPGRLTATLLAGTTLARLTNGLFTAGRHQVRVHPADEGGDPYRFSIVYALRGHLPAHISSDAYTSPVTGPFVYPFPDVEMRELYRAISNAHYNVNINRDLRDLQRKKLAETGNSGRMEVEPVASQQKAGEYQG